MFIYLLRQPMWISCLKFMWPLTLFIHEHVGFHATFMSQASFWQVHPQSLLSLMTLCKNKGRLPLVFQPLRDFRKGWPWSLVTTCKDALTLVVIYNGRLGKRVCQKTTWEKWSCNLGPVEGDHAQAKAKALTSLVYSRASHILDSSAQIGLIHTGTKLPTFTLRTRP